MAGSRSAANELGAGERRRSARLVRGGSTLTLAVEAESRLALRVELDAGATLPDGCVLEGLEVDAEAGPARLGRCRFASSRPGAPSGAGVLVFLDAVYDCRALVEDGTVVEATSGFQSVSMVLAQRERVRPELQRYCANLAYDLAVYRSLFDEQDRLLACEAPEVAATARDAILRSEGRRFMAFIDERLAELARLVAGYSPEEHQRHGYYLRRALWPYISSSVFLRHTNLKPSGYAGDAESMRMTYENAYVGDGLFAQLLHKHPLESAAAESVRSRLALVAAAVREGLARRPGLPAHGFRVLSLASGPACELRGFAADRAGLERLHCTFLDQDPVALDMARQTVAEVERSLGGRADARYVGDSVRTMIRNRQLTERLGRFHLVYSMGLFDYLTPPVARAVLARGYELLAPGGTLLVGNYHAKNPTRVYMDYWMDWPLYYRTEESLRELADGLEGARAEIEFDAGGVQMFLRVVRPEEAHG